MRTEQQAKGKTRAEGIRYDEEAGQYETPWGWIKLDFSTGDCQVSGPGVDEWFRPEEVVKTAGLFGPYTSSPGMAVALAIHQQYAAWKGAQQLIDHKEGR